MPFDAALPKQIKWSVNDNRFDDKDKNPKSLSLFIPKESIGAFCNHIMNMVDNPDLVRTGKVYNFDTQSNEEVDGIYINGKGKISQDESGAFGSINPQKIDVIDEPAF